MGAPGANKSAGRHEGVAGKGEKKGHQPTRPQQSFRQLPQGSPPQVSVAVRVEVKREARRQQTGRYEAPAHMEHQRHRQQAPSPEPKTI